MHLLDVSQECIVPAPPLPQFAALSYVWGKANSEEIQTTKSNKDELGQPGGLRMNDIPRTVADAMIVCQRLDVPYLWVDRFCIIQDDEDQKHAQIEAMHDIYSNATFTICASAATNSQSGLCGVGETPRPFFRPRAQVAGMDILPILPDISHSVIDRQWDSRGWTFQELKLSKN